MNNFTNLNLLITSCILSLYILSVVSCNKTEVNYITKIDNEGYKHVSEYLIYNNDTLEHGLSNVYKNDTLYFTCNYNSGRLNGEFIKYHNNGNIHIQNLYVNDKIFGEQFIYFKNRTLEKYILFGLDGKPKFHVDYDEEGNVIDWYGNAIGDWYFNDKDKYGNLLSNDTLYYGYIIAKPPSFIRKFRVELLDLENNLIENNSRLIDSTLV
jgi:antitoxin component YwqK of YwqJK toxin-antitoxin module